MHSRRIYASHRGWIRTSRYVARSSGTGASYPVFVHRPACLLYASFRPRLAAIALAFSLALHLHQVGRGTCTPKLLSMPSTQLNRFAVGASFEACELAPPP